MRFDRVFFWLLILFLPTQLGRHFWPNFSFVSGIRVDYLSPTIFFTDILVLALLISFVFQKRPRGRSIPPLWPVLAIFSYLFLVSFLAKIPTLSFLRLLKVAELFLLGFFVYQERPFSLIGKPLSLALFCQSLIGLGQFFKGASLGGLFWWLGERTLSVSSISVSLGDFGGRVFLRPYGTFSHPNSLAGFFLVSLLLVAQDKKLPLWWKTLVGVLASSVLVVSFSQVAWIAGAVIFAFFVLKKVKAVRWVLLSFLLVLSLVATFGILFLKTNSLELQERVWLAKAALQMISKNPFFGVGLSGFIPVLPRFWQGKVFLLQPVHNLFLLVAAETGLFGLAAFCWFWLLLFRKALKNWFLALAVLAIFFTGLFDHYWLTLQQNVLIFTITSSLVWSFPKRV